LSAALARRFGISAGLLTSAVTLVGCLLAFISGVRSLLVRLSGLTELIVEICELVAKASNVVMKIGRAVFGLSGARSSLSRLTLCALGLFFGFSA
jgi:hypothetical protein